MMPSALRYRTGAGRCFIATASEKRLDKVCRTRLRCRQALHSLTRAHPTYSGSSEPADSDVSGPESAAGASDDADGSGVAADP